MNRKTVLITCGAGAAAVGAAVCSERLKPVLYEIRSSKIDKPIRICHISDLHSSLYGKNQKKLVTAVKELNPSYIMMTGDIVDDCCTSKSPYILCRQLAKRYRCFYVSGNHEFYNSKDKQIKARLRSLGVEVLEGETVTLSSGEGTFSVTGTDDPYIPIDKKGRIWEQQFEDIRNMTDGEKFSILLSHRPELADMYRETDFDLILSGHAHGGQVIVPGLINGLYAPHQGAFPKYAGGKYRLKKDQYLIVSRGLAKKVRPRVFNRPELVAVDIIPYKK